MNRGRFLPVCGVAVTASLALLTLVGCGGSGKQSAFSTKLNDRHPSSQRAFLEKLVVSAERLENSDLRLREKWFVAHNGYGQVDVGGLLTGLKVKALEQKKSEAETAVVAEQAVAVMALGEISQKTLAVLPEVAPSEDDSDNAVGEDETADTVNTEDKVITIDLTEAPAEEAQEADEENPEELAEVSRNELWRRMDDEQIDEMISRVRPKGSLEGYGQVIYTCFGKDMRPVTVQYFLSHYPVDYLRDSEVSASNSGADHEDDVAEAEETSQERILFELKEIDSQAGLSSYALFFGGLEIHLTAEKGNENTLKHCADLLAQRIGKEIELNHKVIAELREDEKNAGPGDVELGGVWGHLSRHIDLEQKEYQPIRRKF